MSEDTCQFALVYSYKAHSCKLVRTWRRLCARPDICRGHDSVLRASSGLCEFLRSNSL